MLDVTLGGAFVAGLLSFVSPCVLPIVPPYLCWLAGISLDEARHAAAGTAARRRLTATAFVFALGFATVFVALGASASVVGQLVARHFDTLAILAGLLIAAMGLHFLGAVRIPLLQREMRLAGPSEPRGVLAAYLVGLAFAFGWTPCVGPILATILFIAGAEPTAWRGALLLAVYSLGIGLPFVLVAAFAGRLLPSLRRLGPWLPATERAVGALLVLSGLLFVTGQPTRIAAWLVETFPIFATIG